MNKTNSICNKPEALKKMEKNDPLKYRAVSKNIETMVKSLNKQEKKEAEAQDQN